MKVNDPNGADVRALGRTQEVGTPGQSSRSRVGPRGPNDQVQLSNLSSALQIGSARHTAKLAQLSAIVGAGGYQVDPHALSGSIIGDALSAAA